MVKYVDCVYSSSMWCWQCPAVLLKTQHQSGDEKNIRQIQVERQSPKSRNNDSQSCQVGLVVKCFSGFDPQHHKNNNKNQGRQNWREPKKLPQL